MLKLSLSPILKSNYFKPQQLKFIPTINITNPIVVVPSSSSLLVNNHCKLFHYELFDPSKMICVRDFDDTTCKYKGVELIFNDKYKLITIDELNHFKKVLQENQIETNKHTLYYQTVLNKKEYFYEISDWFINNLLFYNYKQWSNSHTIKVLKLSCIYREDFNCSTINGQVLDSIVNLLIAQHSNNGNISNNNLNEIKELLPTLSDDYINEIVKWIKRYLFFYPNTLHIPHLLQSIEIDNTKQVDKYIDNHMNNDIYNESDEEKLSFLSYASTKLMHSKWLDFYNTYYYSYFKYIYNVPQYLYENFNFQENVQQELLENCLRINERVAINSQTHKMIELTIDMNNKSIDFAFIDIEPIYYMLAILIYNYSKYIRRIKWPNVDFEQQEGYDCIGSIMMDLMENRVTISQVYKWIENIELKYSEGKKIWFHFTLKLDGLKSSGAVSWELYTITIPLVFCRGHESITCYVYEKQ